MNNDIINIVESDGYCVTDICISDSIIEKSEKYLLNIPKEENGNFYTSIWSEDRSRRKSDFDFIKEVVWSSISVYFPGYRLVMANFMIKKNGENSFLGLHQDWTFTDETKQQSYNIWIPFENTVENNGPLCVIPSSHKIKNAYRGKNIKQVFPGKSNWLKFFFGKRLLLKAGNAVVFSTKLLHYSENNYSNRNRNAVSMVIVPENSDLLHFYKVNESENKIYQIKISPDYFIDYSLQDLPDSQYSAKVFKTNPVGFKVKILAFLNIFKGAIKF